MVFLPSIFCTQESHIVIFAIRPSGFSLTANDTARPPEMALRRIIPGAILSGL
jgi:hypothetical protein